MPKVWALADECLKTEIFQKCDMVEGPRRACYRYPIESRSRTVSRALTTTVRQRIPVWGGKVEVLPEGADEVLKTGFPIVT
jgi:hypothetical protein